jgi:hypothetical protein
MFVCQFDFCKKEFIPTKKGNHNQRFCSELCRSREQTRRNGIKDGKKIDYKWLTDIRTCPLCVSSFFPKHWNSVFCTRECKNKYHNNSQLSAGFLVAYE